MGLRVGEKAQFSSLDEIFAQANQGNYFDYESKKLQSVNFIERIVRVIFSAFGLMDSTTAKCIRVSSESLLKALQTPNDSFVTETLRNLVEKLENATDPDLIKLANRINKLAPKLIQECITACREMRAELLGDNPNVAKVEKASTTDPLQIETIEKREKAVTKREGDVTKREEAVTIRETNVEARETEVKKAKKAVKKREEAVKVKEKELKDKEIALNDREAKIKAREDKFGDFTDAELEMLKAFRKSNHGKSQTLNFQPHTTKPVLIGKSKSVTAH